MTKFLANLFFFARLLRQVTFVISFREITRVNVVTAVDSSKPFNLSLLTVQFFILPLGDEVTSGHGGDCQARASGRLRRNARVGTHPRDQSSPPPKEKNCVGEVCKQI